MYYATQTGEYRLTKALLFNLYLHKNKQLFHLLGYVSRRSEKRKVIYHFTKRTKKRYNVTIPYHRYDKEFAGTVRISKTFCRKLYPSKGHPTTRFFVSFELRKCSNDHP